MEWIRGWKVVREEERWLMGWEGKERSEGKKEGRKQILISHFCIPEEMPTRSNE